MKRPTHNPVPAVASMLESCSDEEVYFFFMKHACGKALCVYPICDDARAARHAVVIPEGADPFVQAAVIGLVRRHNLQRADRTSAAAATFIRTCTADYYFGYGFGEET
ncbi:MAG: hypothetical protein ABSB70_11805 [Candidatus Velthaea sp.]|jgi:hypothetical protein